MRTRWAGHHRVGVSGAHSESRASHRAAQRLRPTQAWPGPSRMGTPGPVCFASGRTVASFLLLCECTRRRHGRLSRAGPSLHALTGATQGTAWRRTVGHTDGITTVRSTIMGNTTDKIKRASKTPQGR